MSVEITGSETDRPTLPTVVTVTVCGIGTEKGLCPLCREFGKI
jgi:hypothetical protein